MINGPFAGTTLTCFPLALEEANYQQTALAAIWPDDVVEHSNGHSDRNLGSGKRSSFREREISYQQHGISR